jgi:1,4-alpha-glucan branching enzyme
MFGHPGKKLMFQGGEIGMHNEWNSLRSLDWHILDHEDDAYHHRGLQKLVSDCNRVYRDESALWELDFSAEGFSWIDFEDRNGSVVAFIRRGREWHNLCVFVCNFTPVVRENYRIGVPHAGFYKEILNTDAYEYGGSGNGNMGGKNAEVYAWQKQPWSINLTLPPLSTSIFKWIR